MSKLMLLKYYNIAPSTLIIIIFRFDIVQRNYIDQETNITTKKEFNRKKEVCFCFLAKFVND